MFLQLALPGIHFRILHTHSHLDMISLCQGGLFPCCPDICPCGFGSHPRMTWKLAHVWGWEALLCCGAASSCACRSEVKQWRVVPVTSRGMSHLLNITFTPPTVCFRRLDANTKSSPWAWGTSAPKQSDRSVLVFTATLCTLFFLHASCHTSSVIS